MFSSLITHRRLVWQMARREVVGRYQGSMLGLVWSLFHPILMLIIYTFVFGVIFKARWPGVENNEQFAAILFSGLIVYGLFSECIGRAPTLVLQHAAFVKKVVFPLQVLPWITLLSSLFHAAISIGVIIVFLLMVEGSIAWTAALLPVVLVPLLLLIMGIAWLLASLGVFVRDVGQVINVALTAMMFLSPIFYPASAFPEGYRAFFYLNPLTFIIEQTRKVLLWGQMPDWQGLLLYTVVATFCAWMGYLWFQKTRQGFADVL